MTNEIKEILEMLRKYGSTNDKVLLDYITNLQEDLANYVNVVLHDRKVIDDYESRNEKAIEYIENHILATETEDILLKILKGEDK